MMKPLSQLDLAWKLLITCFLIVLTSGFIVAELYLKHTTEKVDGKEGLGLDDITFQFHGDRTKNTLQRQVEGGMRKYFSETGDEADLTEQDKADIAAVVAWSIKPAEEGYWDPKLKDKDKNNKAIYNVMSNHGCYDCHSPEPTMKNHKKDSPLDTYAGVEKFTKPDMGMDTGRLLSLSHIHLLGMGMMFLLAGAAVAATRFPTWLRCALVVGGLSSVLLDIFGWWGVKWFGAPLALVVMFSGILMAVSFTGSVILALWDIWLTGKKSAKPAMVEPPVLVDHGHA